jgi:hypothetical protein
MDKEKRIMTPQIQISDEVDMLLTKIEEEFNWRRTDLVKFYITQGVYTKSFQRAIGKPAMTMTVFNMNEIGKILPARAEGE